MTVELGHIALILAFVVAVVQMVVPMVGASRGWADWMRVAVPAASVQFILTLAAFAVLMHAFRSPTSRCGWWRSTPTRRSR